MLQNERGMALAVAIFTLVVVGALVAGALFVGTQEQRVGSNSSRTEQSFRMAELGVAEVIGGWSANRLAYNRMRAFPLDTTKLAWTKTANGTGSYSGNVFKLTTTQFLLDITASDTMSRAGRVREGGTRQRIGIVVRILPLAVDMQAALTVGGPVVFGGGNVFVKGQDTPPPAANGWGTCGTPVPTIAGVRAKNAGDVANSSGQVSGSPNVLITPSMDSSTFSQFGATNYAALAATANVVLGPGTYAPAPAVVGAVCNTNVMTNWGDGNNRGAPCGSYFPIIHITGNATLSGGQGQGILLADGNLVLSGSFTFYGLVLTRGSFSTVPGGSSKVYGSVMAQSINLATTAFNGDVVINYSNCALTQALQYTGVPALNRSRSWTQLF
ncbi:MAG TPA: hypothetical protein VN908_12940 [Gemmatimonadales bacterium]|nr:hypothetical protein [Gemmatimonadales bacterium]